MIKPDRQVIAVPYLSPEVCRGIADKVLASPRVQGSIARKEGVFRLGAELETNWWQNVEQFRGEFDELGRWLASYLGVEVEYHPKLPPPGFHIFYATAPNGGKIHADGQAFFSAAHIDLNLKFKNVWSVVISVNMPPAGGGLHVWNKPLAQFAREWGDINRPLPAPCYTVPMPVGHAILFDSRLLHQIEGFQISDIQSQARITLVAHLGEVSEGRYVYFWDKLKNVLTDSARADSDAPSPSAEA